MKQYCNRKRIAALAALALLLAGFGPSYRAYAATITVTTFADNLSLNGDCSLREAIQAANTDTAVDACPAGSGADTIQLAAGTYGLSLANLSGDENANQTGDLDILGNLTIKGIDANTTEISTTVALDRILQVPAGSTVTLTGITISYGRSDQNGGAIANSGMLTLNGVAIKKSIAAGNGGGIFNDAGTINITESTFNDNQAQYGGGIYNNGGTIAIRTCIVNNDEATNGGDGGGIYNNATLTISNCWIHDNMASSSNGGGIYNRGTASINNSFIHSSYALQSGGNVYSGNSGGLSSLTISNTTISQGFGGANGGGVFNQGALDLTNVTITRNNASKGGGIYNAENTQPLTLTNTTVVTNSTSPSSVGAGIFNAGAAPLTLKNSLVSHNDALGNCSGLISSAGYNLANDSTCSLTATGDLSDTNPVLGPWQDNGGVTFPYGGAAPTYALLPGSPAINAGTNLGCPSTDQRGVSRPHGPSCDIGAYEANDKPATQADAYATDEDVPLVVSQPGVLGNDTDPDNDPLTASLLGQPHHGALVFNANGSFSYTPDANYHGMDNFSYRASDGALSSGTTVVSLTVTSLNDPPVAVADTYSTNHDTPLNISQPGVLANDSDADGEPITAALVSGPAHGVLALLPNGSFSYTPNASYFGPDAFSYRASDGVSLSAIAMVSIAVQGQNRPPVAGSDVARTSIDTPLLIPVAALLVNDSDPDGNPLTISDVRSNSARGGRVMFSGSNVAYTPPAQFSGIDTFIYTLSDGNGGTASGTVTVTVGMRQLFLPAVRR